MGYETRLYIGKSSSTSDEYERGVPILDRASVYRPYLKDESDNLIKTGRVETYFMVYAMIDLCKCGHDSHISKVDWKNKDSFRVWYFYGEDGNNEIKEDSYGDSSKPVPAQTVIEALEKDVKVEDYRRFEWALALLKSMTDDKENIEVMFYGY